MTVPQGGVGYDLVVVGTSWGGLAALRMLVGGLPGTFKMAIVLVQHRHKESDHLLRTLLQQHAQEMVGVLVPMLHEDHGHPEVLGQAGDEEAQRRQPAPRGADHGDVVPDSGDVRHFTFRYSFSVGLSFS